MSWDLIFTKNTKIKDLTPSSTRTDRQAMVASKHQNKRPDPSTKAGVVSIIGPPNAGKSTLLNAILGQKLAIVSPKPQTTRTRLSGVLNEPRYQIVFVDTPGLHESTVPMNREMVKIARESCENVDAVVFVVDVTSGEKSVALFPHQQRRRLFAAIRAPLVLVLNKIDCIEKLALLPMIGEYRNHADFTAIIPLSAKRGDGVEKLIHELVALLPEGPRYFPEDIPTDASERFLVAEMIREKVFLLTNKEIPYASTVEIDGWHEDAAAGTVTIFASIIVERASQKTIVIGKGGEKIKKIGIAARRDISGLLATKVDLRLWVKVKKNWTRDPGAWQIF
jgi:GTP-binding protein Era